MDTGLTDKVALVTGASSGIGRAIATAFGREGARVAITYNADRAGAEKTAVAVEEAGGRAMIAPLTLGDEGSIQAAVEGVIGAWGGVYALVNNAVQWPRGNPFDGGPDEDWRGPLRAALEGPILVTQAVLPAMRRAGWGRIVHISSTGAEDGMSGMAAYTSAKAGLHGLTRTMAKEFAPEGILTNAVLPGLVTTEKASEVMPRALLETQAKVTPTGRLTRPEDVASLVVFLGSAANGHVNGEYIRVTGGRWETGSV